MTALLDSAKFKCLDCGVDSSNKWYKNKTQCRKCYRRCYRIENHDKELDKQRKYNSLNRSKINQYYNDKYHSDLKFKLAHNLRKRLTKALKGKYKNSSAVTDLGCSLEELQLYLESKFSNGMTWKNYGQWHIDHIIPLSKFDLTQHESLQKALNFKNLQPLWKQDNLRKSNK